MLLGCGSLFPISSLSHLLALLWLPLQVVESAASSSGAFGLEDGSAQGTPLSPLLWFSYVSRMRAQGSDLPNRYSPTRSRGFEGRPATSLP